MSKRAVTNPMFPPDDELGDIGQVVIDLREESKFVYGKNVSRTLMQRAADIIVALADRPRVRKPEFPRSTNSDPAYLPLRLMTLYRTLREEGYGGDIACLEDAADMLHKPLGMGGIQPPELDSDPDAGVKLGDGQG